MGVYIKGIEMPDNCALCPMWDAGNCLAASEAIICEYDKRPQDCPLVPVPPHGRLIDADALVERIDGIWDCNDMVFKPNDKICKIPEDCKGCKWEQTKDCIQRMVENAPTVIEAEEGE